MPTPPVPIPAERRSGPWQHFRGRHLHDYTDAAARAWLVIVGLGALALAWALADAVMRPGLAWSAAGSAVVLTALASRSALKLPGSTYTFSAADLFIFGALATVGPAPAVLAAGVEGWIGSRRTSRRLSSWLASPAAGMFAMAVSGAAFEGLRAGLAAAGMNGQAAAYLALVAVAPLQYAAASLSLMAMMALKRGEAMRPRAWLADTAWVAALYLGAAMLAGLVAMGAHQFGTAVLVASAASVFLLVLLLRVTLARHEAEQARQEALVSSARHEAVLNQQRFTAAFTHAAIGMAVVRPDGRVLQVNQALCTLLAGEAGALLGRPFADTLHAEDVAALGRLAEQALKADGAVAAAELRLRRLHHGVPADERWAEVHASRYDDTEGAGACLIYQLHDITARRRAEAELQHIAYHDEITGLPNRHGFHEHLASANERSRISADHRFAVLYLDLDRFKTVNDSLGHAAGNSVLGVVAQKLRALVRPADVVARLGGDEFAVLIESLADHAVATALAGRLVDALSQPLNVAGTRVALGCSVGITFSDLGYRTIDEILRDADLAMYAAKSSGRSCSAVFDSSMHERAAQRLALEGELHQAIAGGQLSLVFQPIYQLAPHRLHGFEALARWTHPTRGPISPAVFVPLAEETGHMEALTSWVIEQAAAQLAAWQRSLPAGVPLGLHVNVSGRDLTRADFVSAVQQALARHALAGGSITLEITETTLMGHLDAALATMRELRRAGVRFSIDDFGTGYSSLAYLSTLPIDSLKIDRSFVTRVHERPQNLEIVRAVVQLARALGRRVVAEGIETAAELDTVQALGVDDGQGYLLGRPLPPEVVTRELLAPLAAPG